MPDTIERELVDLERRYWQALKDRDVAAAVELTRALHRRRRAGRRACSIMPAMCA